jgi:TRAP-type C4-dicarboxylate transport system substrate-binding protein
MALACCGVVGLALWCGSALGAAPASPAEPGAATASAAAPVARSPLPITLKIVGGLAGVNQYTRHEEPFWTQELPRLSGGRMRADIVAFDRAGIRGQDMLRLMQLGVVPFGTALVSMSAANAPLISAADLAGLSPDMASLRRHATAYRPFLDKLLREQHGIELLAVYVYPAQMLFCKRAFSGLADLAGRRIRVAGPTQSDWVDALGATPVSTPFAELTQNVRNGNVDCAITGSMSGFTIGLNELTTHLLPMPVTWGMAIFGANTAAWQALPADQRAMLKQELLRLEQAIWAEAERETGEGVRCLTGAQACGEREPGRMATVPVAPADEQRRRAILAGQVLERWVQRCGGTCAEAWNQTIAPVSGVEARPQ